jgi:hypothetical protein
MLRGQECSGTVARIRVQVLHRTTIIIHVQGVIRVMVVVGILTMHDQVLKILNLLRHRPGTEHRQ